MNTRNLTLYFVCFYILWSIKETVFYYFPVPLLVSLVIKLLNINTSLTAWCQSKVIVRWRLASGNYRLVQYS
ncbi:hypothetical protein SAMN04487909_102298 [Aneurinibacillus migulanus]|uniref:Uncharacterized protein n=1 Tax=Aneurinibacillus migulanus TaxID=47500 RepID=A0A1G8J3S2_ANEMI|nr:hypothetical protein SAMN04487909_102298 [Aneurinibacillus migulanus]